MERMTLKQKYHETLDTFFIKVVDRPEEIRGLDLNHIVEKQMLESLIEKRTECIQATDHRAGGANMMKWLGNLVTAHLYFLFVENKSLSYQQLAFVDEGKDAYMEVIQPILEEVPLAGRLEYIRENLSQLFATCRPLFEGISKSSGLSIQQTWGLIANPFYNHIDSWINNGDAKQVEINLELLKSITPSVFGLKRNPYDVTFRYVSSWQDANKSVRIKAACCMSYLKAEGNYCFSCPKLSPEKRLARGEQSSSK